MTNNYEIIQEAQKELQKAIWAGALEYADEGNFDDLKARDNFVGKQIGLTIQKLERYIRKTRPVQNGKKRKTKPY